MYVMRSKVTLQHASDTQTLFGIFGESALSGLTKWFPLAPATPYQLVSNNHGTLLRLTDVEGLARYQCVVAKDGEIEQAINLWPHLVPESEWLRSEIHAGIPHVSAATQEKFVPQMINYELIGGVNFKKGCYPGQEIVARTHYLGKQKRRTVLAHIPSATVISGMEVFASTDLEQPCGMVVNAVLNNNGGSDCLIEIKTNFLSDATIQLSTGEVCQWLPMPYPLPDEATPTS
jgi:folate-binding protein YgfZ